MNAIFLLLLLTLDWTCATDLYTINFVKSFIENESKPTHLVYNLCWRKSTVINLVNEVASIGVRSSASMKPSKYRDQEVLILLDMDCPKADHYIFNATSNNLQRSPYRWLVLHNSLNSNESRLAAIWNSPLLADSDFVLAQRSKEGFRLMELHKPSTVGPMHSTIRGYYNGTLTDVRPHRELFRRRRDMMGHALIMSNVIQDSNTTQYHLLQEDRLEPNYDSLAKICWSNARIALEMLNATPRYIFSYRYGYKQNGRWSGMIDDLHNKKADLGSDCFMLTERLDIVAYIDCTAPFNLRFIFRQPPLSFVSNIFSLPFSTTVWVALAGCAAVSTATLYLTSRHEARFGKSPYRLDGNIGDALLLTISALSQQGCVMEPRKTSGRILILILFTAMMALYAAYSANIVVLLQASSNSINSLAQLAYSKITLAALDIDYNHFIFKVHEDPVRIKIYKKIEPEKERKPFYDLNEGVEKIRQGLFAFHSLVDPVYRRIEKTFLDIEKCDLMDIDFLNSFDTYMPMRKDLPYLELMRVAVKQIRESGIQRAISRRYLLPKPRCSNKGAAFSSVGLQDLMPVMILMASGVAVSVAIAIVEIVVFRFQQRRNRASRHFKRCSGFLD